MKAQQSPLSVVDLFSGAGGMSWGFHQDPETFRIVGAADKQVAKPGLGKSKGTTTDCNSTYEANIGLRPTHADLAVMSPAAFREALGLRKEELGVLISCAPCTGFSQKKALNHTTDDPRNRLVERTADFVREFMPKYVVMENVKELVQGNQRHHFDALRTQLAERLRYHVWFAVHDLAAFGLPQRRLRALIIAARDHEVTPFSPPSAARRATVRETIGHLPPLAAGETSDTDAMHTSPRITARVLDRLRAIPKDGGSWADVMNDPEISARRKRYLLIPAMFRARPGSFPDVYGRLWWDRPAVTITRECGHVGNGRYVHPDQDRLLTVREMALLQGFPQTYTFVGRLTARYNQIGDAVPPLVSTQIAAHVKRMASLAELSGNGSRSAAA